MDQCALGELILQKQHKPTFMDFVIDQSVCRCTRAAARKCELMCVCVPSEFHVSLSFVRVPVHVHLKKLVCACVYVGCIIGRSRPDTAGGIHQAVTRRDREESRVAVRRPF